MDLGLWCLHDGLLLAGCANKFVEEVNINGFGSGVTES